MYLLNLKPRKDTTVKSAMICTDISYIPAVLHTVDMAHYEAVNIPQDMVHLESVNTPQGYGSSGIQYSMNRF